MKLTFSGWDRTQYNWPHDVTPVVGWRQLKRDGGLVWETSAKTYGKLTGLQLSGGYKVAIEVTPADMQGWVMKYAQEFPEDALRLFATAQAEALISLGKARAADDAE